VDAELKTYISRRSAVLTSIRRMLVVCLRLQCPPEEIDPDTALFGTGLGIDSLDAVEIVVGLEVEFGVTLQDAFHRRRSFRSVNLLVDLVLESMEARPARS
jgi:acyl carrier protein